MKIIIFTDLDGTFLNHDDYSYNDSLLGVRKVLSENIPLIFTTSKTKVEVETLHERLKINEPFIIENGAALFIPKNYKEFFDLNINYCLITRLKNENSHPSALIALNSTKQVFQLKMLENTFVNQTNILVTPTGIYKLLSRITRVPNMIYTKKDGTKLISF